MTSSLLRKEPDGEIFKVSKSTLRGHTSHFPKGDRLIGVRFYIDIYSCSLLVLKYSWCYMGWFNQAKGRRGFWWMASNADPASSKHRLYFILALPPLIQKSKQTQNKSIKKKTFEFPSQYTNKITDDPVRQDAFSFIKRGDRYGYA